MTAGAFGVVDGRHVGLPRIGVVGTKEPTVKLVGRLDCETARVLSATVSETAGGWHVSFGCEVTGPDAAPPPGLPVGVDVGVKHLAALSTGEIMPNPKHLRRYARRVKRLQVELARRQAPSKGRPPSRRWRDRKVRLGQAHAKVAAARRDGLHKLTTTVAKGHQVVVVEDLNVAAMTATAKGSGRWRGKAGLNRAILDAAPAELRRQLAYKTAWYRSTLVVADRWRPSSKTCSRCKTVKAKLPLAERSYRCDNCRLVMDRDLNAALNLAALVDALSGTGSGPGTGHGDLAYAHGEERSMASPRCSSANCEHGASPSGPDKTVTATRQRVAPKAVLIGSDR